MNALHVHVTWCSSRVKINRAIPVSDDEDEGKRPRSPARPVVRRRPKESIAMPDWLHDYRYKFAKEQRQKKREKACGASATPAFASEDFHHHAENMTDSFGMENWMKSETPFPVLAQCCIASTVFRRELLAIESPPATVRCSVELRSLHPRSLCAPPPPSNTHKHKHTHCVYVTYY